MNTLSSVSTSTLRKAIVIKEKIEALNQELSALLGGTVATSSTVEKAEKPAGRRKMSAAARAKIAAAQRARWAKSKSAAGTSAPAPAKKKRTMSAAAKAKISAAAKARWAKVRNAK